MLRVGSCKTFGFNASLKSFLTLPTRYHEAQMKRKTIKALLFLKRNHHRELGDNGNHMSRDILKL